MQETIYDRIRKLSSLTIKQLEIELGFSQGSIQKWKSSEPSAIKLFQVAEKLGTTIEYLLFGREKQMGKEQKNFTNSPITNSTIGDVHVNGNNNSLDFNKLDNSQKKELTGFNVEGGKKSVLSEIRAKADFYESNEKFNLLFNNSFFGIVVENFLKMETSQQFGVAVISKKVAEEKPNEPWTYAMADEEPWLKEMRLFSPKERDTVLRYTAEIIKNRDKK